MHTITLVKHGKGALGLRTIGLGPYLRPTKGLQKLQSLLNEYAIWAKNRTIQDLKIMLANSSVVISLWQKNELIGFGRATSDYTFRAMLWDVVVKEDQQGVGNGKKIIKALLSSKPLIKVQNIYLMTTNKSQFYEQVGFKKIQHQNLMILNRENNI